MPLLQPLLSVILPVDCPACGQPGGVLAATRLCAECDRSVPHLPRAIAAPEPLLAAWALGPYQGPLGALVRHGKYGPNVWLVQELGQRLAGAAAGRMPRVDTVTHVPVFWQRRLRRGFDQAALLAMAVARAIGTPHASLLRRVERGEQAGRSDADRRRLARSAYRAREARNRPRPLGHVLLVDDVVTTGATASACADELLGAGAASVVLLAAASGRA